MAKIYLKRMKGRECVECYFYVNSSCARIPSVTRDENEKGICCADTHFPFSYIQVPAPEEPEKC